MEPKSFAPRALRQAMAAREIKTMRHLAQLAGVNENTLYSIDSGRARPSAETLASLSAALGCLIDDFFVAAKSTQVVSPPAPEAPNAAVA